MNKKIIILSSIIFIVLLITFFFDKGLALGTLVIFILSGITFLILPKNFKKDRLFLLILFITIVVHLLTVLFVHYTNFQPFGKGDADYVLYNQQAQEMSQRFHNGDFTHFIGTYSGEYTFTYYSVVIGVLYAVTVPQMIVGQMFGVWLAMITVFLVYLLILEIGGTKKQAFITGLIVSLYPSFLFYSSYLLKDTIIIPLAIASLLLIIKLIENFSCRNFIIFYLTMAALTHLRFYISYVSLFVFILCWTLFSNLQIRKRLLYAVIIIFLLGFLPQIVGAGYFGIDSFKHFLSDKQITFFRESAYQPAAERPLIVSTDSSFSANTNFNNPLLFAISYVQTYIYALLGPFPWQLKYLRQFSALVETIPWYFLLFFAIKGALRLKNKYKIILPLILFSLGVFSILGLFTTNFGIITRIRIPAFIALACFSVFGFNFKNKYIVKIENYLIKNNL